MATYNYETALQEELLQLQRSSLSSNTSDGAALGALSEYSNRLFGAPYQLLDSVDRRFPSVNKYLGSEYLRNFMLNSPILYIRPGMPTYTGNEDDTTIIRGLQNLYTDVSSGTLSALESIANTASRAFAFGVGNKLQKRMFGLRETYYDYMSNVNYMCHSAATFIGLTESGEFPNFAFANTGDVNNPYKLYTLDTFPWENYRMSSGENVQSPTEYLKTLLGTVPVIGGVTNGIDNLIDTIVSEATKSENGGSNDLLNSTQSYDFSIDSIVEAFQSDQNSTIYSIVSGKNTTVQFMVEPVSFEETFSNDVDKSIIESTIDSIGNSVGSEIAFITNSRADAGIIGDLTTFLGNTTSDAALNISELIQPVTGGFATNLFSGAIRSLQGQKMIYPDIYKSSNSSMDYQYSITLSTPYGDIYNYYMNIIVPLMHLIALVAPRMVTSNTIASPFLVQSFIPGMATCPMGIFQNMVVTKNPTTKHVSVNGFPLTVKVTFTIRELYNAMSISPGNDPASFMYNETLNDYLCNISGLIPSAETFARQRENALNNVSLYFSNLPDNIIGDSVNQFTNTFLNTPIG